MEKGKKIVLIDGHSILNRAFYGVPDLTNAEGMHTNAVYGFLNIMFKILDEEKPDYLTVAFDLSDPTFRKEMYAEYKGTRKPMPPELREQVPLVQEALRKMGVTIVTKSGYEADDILGTIAKHAEKEGVQVSLVSGDRDLLQLATDVIRIRIPKTKKGGTEIENYNMQEVIDTYGVTPVEFIDMKALMGDASDNIPGVPGIGEKTAGAIISKFHSIENAYEHLDEVTPNKARNNLGEFYEQAQLSKTLATIIVDAPIDYDIEKATFNDMFNSDAYEFFKRMEFKSILNRFDVSKQSICDEVSSKFKLVDDFNEVNTIFDKINKTTVEALTVGIYIPRSDSGEVLGAALCTDADSVYFIPVQGFVTEPFLIDRINELQKRLADSGMLSLINLKEMLDIIDAHDGDNVADLSVMAYLLNPLKDEYHYDDIAKDYMGILLKSRIDILAKLTLEAAYDKNLAALSEYSCCNAYVAYSGFDVLQRKLVEQNMLKLYKDIELPLIFVLREMEKNGIRVNRDDLQDYGCMLKDKISATEKEIYDMAGMTFNINSPKQLGEVLFEKMGIKGGKKTKTGYSTSADILEKLAPDWPIINKILDYRQFTKLNSTYVEGLSSCIREDGRIHGKFNQTITATGRISSTEPNLQNIPIRIELGRQIRKVFVPRDGYKFIDSDYSQIELRILAHMSGDENLIESYNQDADIHRITASKVFKVPLEEVTKTQRSNAKAVNFGIVYGISSFGLSQDLSISRNAAKEYIESYFETYPKVKQFLDNLVSSVREKGYSETVYGRRRPVPEIRSSNFMQRQFGERIAMNSPIQGTAADVMKIAMIGVCRKLKELNLKSKLILQVHDELLIEAAEDEIETVKQIVETQMKNAASFAVPLIVDTNIGDNWLEAH